MAIDFDNQIRSATNGNYVLGGKRFQKQIELEWGEELQKEKRGGQRYVKTLNNRILVVCPLLFYYFLLFSIIFYYFLLFLDASQWRGRQCRATNVSSHGIWLLYSDKELFISYEDFPWFKDVPIGKIINVKEMSPKHFYWPDLDIDLSVEIIEHP